MLWDQKSCLKNKVAAQLDANINSEKLKIIVAVDIVLFPNKKTLYQLHEWFQWYFSFVLSA